MAHKKQIWWLRLREKNGKLNEMLCHHKLETYLDAYIQPAGIEATVVRGHYSAPGLYDRRNDDISVGDVERSECEIEINYDR